MKNQDQEPLNKVINMDGKASNTISHNVFTVEDNKGEHMEILHTTAKALLNITEFFKGKQVVIESMIKVESSAADEDEITGE